MFTAFVTETFLGLSLIMGALLVSVLSSSRMLNFRWPENGVDEKYVEKISKPFFIYLSLATTPIIFIFLGGLLSIFAPGLKTTQPITFVLNQFGTTLLFYFLAGVTFGVSLISSFKSFKYALSVEHKDLKPISIIVSFYILSWAVFALLLALLVAAGLTSNVNADYVLGGSLILLSSVLSAISNQKFAAWFKPKLLENQDKFVVTDKALLPQVASTMLLSLVPFLAGAIIICS